MDTTAVISFIAEEMLLNSPADDRVQFVTNAAKLAEEDPQMLKLMQLWMHVVDYDKESQEIIEDSMRDYLRRKNLWKKNSIP